MDHNPYLTVHPGAAVTKGGPDGIERPDRVENIPWQTRPAVPTAAEAALADALQAIFADAVDEPAEIVRRLNQAGVAMPGGDGRWTVESFIAELARLGG